MTLRGTILYEVHYKDWHKEYVRAKSNEEAEEIGEKMYTRSKVWYSREM